VSELLGSQSGKYKHNGLQGCHNIASHPRRHVTGIILEEDNQAKHIPLQIPVPLTRILICCGL